MLEQETDEPNAEAAAPFADLMEIAVTTEQRLEAIIMEADQEAEYHAAELKRRKGIAKATRAALKILREGDET